MERERYVYRDFQIDANRINARQSLPPMNRLERWANAGVISIEMSETAQTEAAAGDPARARKAHGHVYSMTLATTPGEQETLRRIEAVLFPEGVRSPNERADVEIVFNAIKYDRILITHDGGSRRQPGGILGHREQLEKLGAHVVTDEEAVALVERCIRERDRRLVRNSD